MRSTSIVSRVFCNYTKRGLHRLFALMALFAGFSRSHQAVAFHCRFDGSWKVVEHYPQELPRTRHLRADKSGGSRRHMARHAVDARMGRPLVRSEFRLHSMARLSAELHGFHVCHGAVGELSADDKIRHGHDNKKIRHGTTPLVDRPQPQGLARRDGVRAQRQEELTTDP
jgi:hypothetical protein